MDDLYFNLLSLKHSGDVLQTCISKDAFLEARDSSGVSKDFWVKS